MAHYAGLVAAGEYPNPVGIAHFVTSTTHKTLRGPRGGLILSQTEFEKPLNSMIFPGIQGGPLMHVIAAKALAFKEAMTPEFKTYQPACEGHTPKAMAAALTERGLRIVSGGTRKPRVPARPACQEDHRQGPPRPCWVARTSPVNKKRDPERP